MRRREPARVLGPYQERSKWRVVVVENAERRSIFVPTEAEALHLKRKLEREIAGPSTRMLREVIEEFLAHHISTGRALPQTCEYYRQRMFRLLGAYLDKDISDVTPKRAASLYQAETERVYKGRIVAAATHHSALVITKVMFRWAVTRGYIRESPFADVRPVGKANVGKKQLRIDEARLFTETAFRLYSQRGDRLALGALTALLLGVRASEVVRRTVRDLDDGGRILWIDAGKTRNARRHLKVPELLRPYLVALAGNRSPSEFLFGMSEQGQPRRRHSLYEAVHRVCDAAGIQRVCTHSLRGLHATLAVESGAVSEQVAASLGHGSFAVTQRHYAQESAVRSAQIERVNSVLARPTAEPSAEELLRALPTSTLIRLLELHELESRKERS